MMLINMCLFDHESNTCSVTSQALPHTHLVTCESGNCDRSVLPVSAVHSTTNDALLR